MVSWIVAIFVIVAVLFIVTVLVVLIKLVNIIKNNDSTRQGRTTDHHSFDTFGNRHRMLDHHNSGSNRSSQDDNYDSGGYDSSSDCGCD